MKMAAGCPHRSLSWLLERLCGQDTRARLLGSQPWSLLRRRAGKAPADEDEKRQGAGCADVRKPAIYIVVMQDSELADEWFVQAAAQGIAQYSLGICSSAARCVTESSKQQLAFVWLAKAAAQGDANALFSLGICYECGRGVAQDIKPAADSYGVAQRHCFRAAGQGCLAAIKRSFKLGYCECLSFSRGLTGELRAGQASALVRGNACPAGPRSDGLEVSYCCPYTH